MGDAPVGLAAILLGCASAVDAQSLVETAEHAAQVKAAATAEGRDWHPIYLGAGVVEAPDDPATGGDLNRSLFDKAYEAGKAVDAAQYMSAVGITPRQFQALLLAWHTELSIVGDKASTKAEHSLAAKYETAYLQFDLGAVQSASSLRETWTKGLETMKHASATLEAANKVYLGKAATAK